MTEVNTSLDINNVNIKTKLNAMEYDVVVSNTINGIVRMYDNGIYGMNRLTLDIVLVASCTNIDTSDLNLDEKMTLVYNTNIMDQIRKSIGEDTYQHIVADVDLGLRYRVSTNPDTKELIRELATLAKGLNEGLGSVSDESVDKMIDLFKKVSSKAVRK